MLMLQEDEMDWGGSADAAAADPALQHALAVIKAKGVLLLLPCNSLQL